MAKKTNTTINGINYYRLRKTVGKDKNGKDIVKSFYGNSKKDAEYKMEQWLKENQSGLSINTSQSLAQAMYDWLWNVEKTTPNKDATFAIYETVYKLYIQDAKFSYSIVSDIQRKDVQKFYDTLNKEDKSASQINFVHLLLNKFFRYCVQEGYLIKNPCAGIKVSAYKKNESIEDDGEIEAFTEEEIPKVLSAIQGDKLKILVKFALGTGLRQGEILALTVDDVDVTNMIVSVSKTVRRIAIYDDQKVRTYKVVVSTPKNESSKRKVPIPTELKKDLEDLAEIRSAEKQKLGSEYNTGLDLLFPTITGNYIDASTLIRGWKRVFKHTDVPYKKFHALRHTYATLLLKNDVQLITVSKLLGHSSVKTTEIYAHVLESTKRKEVETLNNILSANNWLNN